MFCNSFDSHQSKHEISNRNNVRTDHRSQYSFHCHERNEHSFTTAVVLSHPTKNYITSVLDIPNFIFTVCLFKDIAWRTKFIFCPHCPSRSSCNQLSLQLLIPLEAFREREKSSSNSSFCFCTDSKDSSSNEIETFWTNSSLYFRSGTDSANLNPNLRVKCLKNGILTPKKVLVITIWMALGYHYGFSAVHKFFSEYSWLRGCFLRHRSIVAFMDYVLLKVLRMDVRPGRLYCT